MKLEEAIEGLTEEADSPRYNFDPNRRAALKLGIKALERIDSLRSAGHYIGMPLLKGETQK